MAEAQISRMINPNTGDAIEFRNGQWANVGKAAEDEIRHSMQARIDEQTAVAEQMKLVAESPEYLELKQEQAKQGATSIGKTVLRMAPAIATGVATGGASAALGLGRLATLGLEMGGQATAETIAQKLSGEQFDPNAVALAGAIPAGLRTAGQLVKTPVKGLAGRSTGVQLRLAEKAKGEIEEFFSATRLLPDQDAVNKAYALVGNKNPRVFLPSMRETAKSLAEKEVKNPKRYQDQSLVKDLVDLQKDLGRPTGVPFDRIQAFQQKLNDEISAAEGTKLGALRKLRSSIWHDLENLANTQAAGTERKALGNAINTARRNFALTDLKEAYNSVGVTGYSQGGFEVFSPTAMLNKIKALKQDDLFVRGMGAELPKLETHLSAMSKELMKTSPQGTAIVFGALGGTAGASVGEAMAGMPGAGAAIGASLGVSLPDMLTKLSMHERGRTILMSLMKKGNGRIAMPALITAANAIAAGAQTKPDELKATALAIQKNPNIKLEQKIEMAQQLGKFVPATE